MPSDAPHGERLPARSYAELLLLGSLWSFSFLAMKLAVDTVTPFTVTASRLIIGSILLYGIMRLAGHRLSWTRAAWAGFFGVGFFGNVLPFVLITSGLDTIESGVSAILMAVMPLSTMLLAHVAVRGEPLTGRKIFGCLLGFGGIALLVGQTALEGLGAHFWAEIGTIGGALGFAAAAVIARRMPPLPPTVKATGTLFAAATLCIPMALILEEPFTLAPSASSVAATFWLGLVPSGVCGILYFHIIATAGAGFFSLTNYLVPVLGVVWGALLLGEHFETTDLAALAVILFGIWLAGR